MTKGSSEESRSGTELVAKEAAISSNHPSDAVDPTPKRMAIGADFAAPAVSSETCAAESSSTALSSRRIIRTKTRTYSP
jgi:hypothetical protein